MTELIERLCSVSATAGSGTAGSIAVALAAGCAAKAAAISARRHPENRELADTCDRFCHLATEVLLRADEESARFVQSVQEANAISTTRLVASEENLLQLAERLLRLMAEIAPGIAPELEGDMLAARALRSAGVIILSANRDEQAH